MANTEGIAVKFVEALEAFKKDRDRSVTMIESLCSSLSKSSFFSARKLDNLVAEDVVHSRLQVEVEEEYLEKREKLSKLKGQMNVSMTKIGALLTQMRESEEPVSSLPPLQSLNSLWQSLVQQNSLEDMMIANLVAMFESDEFDQDALVTIVASCKYSPYCNQGEIQNLINVFKS